MTIACTGARCIITNSYTLISGATNIVLNFSFNSEWNNLNKQIYFYLNGIEYVRALSGSTYSIPSEILNSTGALYIGLIGTLLDTNGIFPNSTKVLTTNRTFLCSIRAPIAFLGE